MLYDESNMKRILDIIEGSVDVIQTYKYHPEGNVRDHTLQVFSHAARETNDPHLLMAALTHDIGKTIESNSHEKHSANILIAEEIISNKTLWLVANHMRVKKYIEGEMKGLKKIITFSENPWFVDLVRLHRWDLMGRNPNRKMTFDREVIIDKLNKCEGKKFVFPVIA